MNDDIVAKVVLFTNNFPPFVTDRRVKEDMRWSVCSASDVIKSRLRRVRLIRFKFPNDIIRQNPPTLVPEKAQIRVWLGLSSQPSSYAILAHESRLCIALQR